MTETQEQILGYEWQEHTSGEFRRIRVPGGWIYEMWRRIDRVGGGHVPAWEPYTAVFVPFVDDPAEQGTDSDH